MSGKFLAYALLVTTLSTTTSWGKFLSSVGNSSGSSSYRGSSWSSNTGNWSGSSGSHK